MQPKDGDIVGVIRDIKRYTARVLTEMLERDGRSLWLTATEHAGADAGHDKLWQTGFHPEQIYSEQFFTQKLDYIHNNPVRAGYVDDPYQWKYSIAGFYYNETPSMVDISPIEW